MGSGNVIEVILRAKDEASSAMKGIASSFEENRKAIGVSLTAIGGSILAFGALAVKSSFEEQQGIRTLDQALKLLGTSYDAHKAKIEEVINAQQKKTNYGDEEQRRVLQQLIQLTGDYDVSLSALPVVLDVAAGAGMDLNAASVAVGKALEGNTTALQRYGIELEAGAGATEVMSALMERFGGQAESAANPLTQLMTRVGDVVQVFGSALLPMVEQVSKFITSIAEKIQNFAEQHAGLVKVLTFVAMGIGAVCVVFGTLALLLPTITTAWHLLNLAMSAVTSPIGIVCAAIGLVVAAGILLWRNWETVKDVCLRVWNAIERGIGEAIGRILQFAIEPFVDALAGVIDFGSKIVGFFNKEWGDAMKNAADSMRNGIDHAKEWAYSLGNCKEAASQAAVVTQDYVESVIAVDQAFDDCLDAAHRHNVGLQEVKKTADEVVESYDEIASAVSRVVEEWEYERSVLGALKVSFEDVIAKALELGYTEEQITTALGKHNVQVGDATEAFEALSTELGLDIGLFEAASKEIAKTGDAFDEVKKSTDDATTALQDYLDQLMTNAQQTTKQIGAMSGTSNEYLMGYASYLSSLPSFGNEGAVLNELIQGNLLAMYEQLGAGEEYGAYVSQIGEILREYQNMATYVGGNANWAGTYTFTPEGLAAIAAGLGGAGIQVQGFQHGGVIPELTALYGLQSKRFYGVAGEGGQREYITPNQAITIPIYLDGRLIANYVVDMVSRKARLQGVS